MTNKAFVVIVAIFIGLIIGEVAVYLVAIGGNHPTVKELIEHCERGLPPGQHCEVFIEVCKDEYGYSN